AGAAVPGEAGSLAALQMGLRDSLQGFVRLDQQGAAETRLATEVLQCRRPLAQLCVVQGTSDRVRKCQRGLPPGAVEAGRNWHDEAVLLTERAVGDAAP